MPGTPGIAEVISTIPLALEEHELPAILWVERAAREARCRTCLIAVDDADEAVAAVLRALCGAPEDADAFEMAGHARALLRLRRVREELGRANDPERRADLLAEAHRLVAGLEELWAERRELFEALEASIEGEGPGCVEELGRRLSLRYGVSAARVVALSQVARGAAGRTLAEKCAALASALGGPGAVVLVAPSSYRPFSDVLGPIRLVFAD
ncbi:MAG: hypothetical protein ABWK00_01660 [Desulfurococcaceae archaeon]